MPDVKFPADGKTYIGWIPDPAGTVIDDVHNPELAELSTIVDISCHVTSGGLNLGVSQGTIDTASICSAFVSQANGRVTVSPALTGWRYEQPDDTFWELVENGSLGWLLIRTGIDTDDALADGQMVTLAYVQMSEPMPEFPGGDTASTFVTNMLLVSGRQFDQKAVIGGGS